MSTHFLNLTSDSHFNKKEIERRFSVKDKVAIVTGGGRALGKEMALALGGAGAEGGIPMTLDWEIDAPLDYLGFAFFVFKDTIKSYFQ